MRIRRALTLVELLVVMAIVGLLVGLTLSAVQGARHATYRTDCGSQLRQLGLALHAYHDAHGQVPPGIACPSTNLTGGQYGGFTVLLPYLELHALYEAYDLEAMWHDPHNAQVVQTPVELFFCPANVGRRQILLQDIARQWATVLPPAAAGCDYAFCKGANAALVRDSRRIPAAVRGPFDVNSQTTFGEIFDGLSCTIALGDATGGPTLYRVRDLQHPDRPVIDPSTRQPAFIEQAWAAACTSDALHPYYGSILAVSAQRGLPPDPRYEPMNPPDALVAPTVDGGDNVHNDGGRDWVSGFRSLHGEGCNFVFCDASVRFLRRSIDPAVFVAYSTIAGTAP